MWPKKPRFRYTHIWASNNGYGKTHHSTPWIGVQRVCLDTTLWDYKLWLQGSKIWKGDWKKQRADGNKIPITKIEEFYKNRSLLKVSILPEDIAEGVYFFASTKSIKSTGNILNVDGGNITSFTR